MTSDGVIKYSNRICVPEDGDIRKEILTEVHVTLYSLHPGSTKMYKDLRMYCWWQGMKRDALAFVEKCLTCQQVKAEHQNLLVC